MQAACPSASTSGCPRGIGLLCVLALLLAMSGAAKAAGRCAAGCDGFGSSPCNTDADCGLIDSCSCEEDLAVGKCDASCGPGDSSRRGETVILLHPPLPLVGVSM